jgi:ferritin-like metal-binding protein YciE
MVALKSPEDLMVTELKEIHSAERQLSRALPKLEKQASSGRLREMFERRREQGSQLIERLDDIFDEMDVTKARPKNVAAEGLLEDVNHHVEEIEEKRLLDPVLLASMQKIEHYCIAAWGTARSMGQLMDQKSVVSTMEQVLDDGKRYDKELTDLAEKEVNPAMLAASEEGGEGERAGNGGRGRKSR